MAAMDVDEVDVLDPHADIYALFCYYDSLYFDESLGACSVSWSSSRMTRCAGVCRYLPGGGCEIHLSEPLLKFRSTADVKNTLLHEMIHAFLWIKHNNKDHSSQHGPGFQALMNKINSSSLIDHQKPACGYNITIYHQFHNEVDSYRLHHWICEGCGDLIKRAINREPSAGDCMERFRENGSCGNTSCHWHNHKMVCSGSYKKIAEPPGYKGKRKRAKEQELPDNKLSGRGGIINKLTQKSQSKAESKAQCSLDNMKSLTSFFPSASNRHTGTSLPEDSKLEALKAVEPKMQTLALVSQFPKRPRTAHSQKSKYVCNKRRKVDKEKDRCIVFSKWLGWFADEETDEEVEPLINKRTERRKKLKLLENQKGRHVESQASDATQTANSSTSIFHGNEGELMGNYLLYHQNENGGPVGC
ncbi:DNA-dependent metalloprotease dvc-1-like isoform X1 [Dioscorea cayenensis subsp. rotundata]|uniref:DNA-dependent metalloprotease dvc-1-like isoform X1 n=1 Tax=Dioscorea cayennensis subsp. rotundata TaxID=55577 RepID=A0AB40D317_DIOCR|nr:DNA-dependent metalloprotease dvc-1-like isoform X1 [Dioscorea cayenensis subsp. rotundata]